MRKLLLFVLLCVIPYQLFAGNRSEMQMKEAASSALMSNYKRAGNLNELKEYLSLSKLKVYGYDNGGFAVVSSDDRYESVIGISASTFEGPLPCGFKWWIESINEVMDKGQVPAKVHPMSTRRSGGVGPLMTTKWGQEKPFNNQCKITVNGKDYSLVTGCVATAIAQVMNYLRYALESVGQTQSFRRNLSIKTGKLGTCET